MNKVIKVKVKATPDVVKFVLRLPPKIHRQIKRAAKTNNTSMNKEIVNILQGSMDGDSVNHKLDELLARTPKRKRG